ncbi:MAG: hypothetical protein WAK83_30175 [Trebonia sp.]
MTAKGSAYAGLAATGVAPSLTIIASRVSLACSCVRQSATAAAWSPPVSRAPAMP